MLELLLRPIRVHPFFGYRNGDCLRISARALRTRATDFGAATGQWQALRTMLSQFLSREVPELPVRLEVAQADGTTAVFHAITNAEGYVHFDAVLPNPCARAAQPLWETVVFHWEDRYGAHDANGFILAPGSEAQLAVISDIDDTIIETGITGGVGQLARNWRRVLAQLPAERLIVPGADVFYNALGGGTVLPEGGGTLGEQHAGTRNPFFYISSSPWNLFSYLVAFQRGRGLPLGPLMLRDWGPNAVTFGGGSHGAHKRAAIDELFAFYPHLDFALVGDDTQADLVAYGETVARYGKRVRAVFVRQAGEALSEEEIAARATIEQAGVPLWLGNDYATGDEFLGSIGLGTDTPAHKVMATTVKDPAAVSQAA
jgi:phosphatidate phosphatase APP1